MQLCLQLKVRREPFVMLRVAHRLMAELLASGFQLILKDHVILQSFDSQARPC